MKKRVAFASLLIGLTGACNDAMPTEDPVDDASARQNRTTLNRTLNATLTQLGGKAAFTMPPATQLQAIPADPKNPLSAEKVALGKLLFHDPGLLMAPKDPRSARTGSCASCHHVAAGFQAGRVQGLGEGGRGFGAAGESRVVAPDYTDAMLDAQAIRSPTALNVAWQTNMLWNGQFGATGVNVGTEARWTAGTPKATNALGFEGVETQAIAGQGVHRLDVIKGVAGNATYARMFAAAYPFGHPSGFDSEPREGVISRVTAGMAIAAYERTLLATEAPFQKWLRGNESAMSNAELAGANLFFGKAGCVSCHTGPALNSMAFYALGMDDLHGTDVRNCPPDAPEHLGRGAFTGNPADNFKFKVPQLYNLADSPFYGHGSSFERVRDVIAYKNNGQKANSKVPTSALASEFRPLGLTSQEVDQLTSFVLSALRDPELDRYVPSKVPSGLCFPNADAQSMGDLGCE